MPNFFALVLVLFSTSLFAGDGVYHVDSAIDDETLVINGINFAAQSYCHDVLLGDEVVFVSGDPNGECTEAQILNLRTNQVCNTWCQAPILP